MYVCHRTPEDLHGVDCVLGCTRHDVLTVLRRRGGPLVQKLRAVQRHLRVNEYAREHVCACMRTWMNLLRILCSRFTVWTLIECRAHTAAHAARIGDLDGHGQTWTDMDGHGQTQGTCVPLPSVSILENLSSVEGTRLRCPLAITN